jgi:CRP-like cAMP-binding protein
MPIPSPERVDQEPMMHPQNNLLAMLDPGTERAFFRSLSPFSASLHAVVQRQSEPVEHVCFPSEGMVSLVSVMHDGKAAECCVVGFDSAIGIGAALSGRNALCRAVVQLPLRGHKISVAQFRQAYADSPAIRAMVNDASDRMIAQAQQAVACGVLHDTGARLAGWLLRSADYAEGKTLHLTQEFMAEMLGVRRSTVTQLACRLYEKGLIDYARGRLTLLDRAGLGQVACECYAALAPERHRQQVQPAATVSTLPAAAGMA